MTGGPRKIAAGVQIDAEDLHLFEGQTIYIGSNGYAYVSTNLGGPELVHSRIMGVHPGKHVDHINGDKLDNRRANLRVATVQKNQVNRKRLNKNNTSGIRGVRHAPHLSSARPWHAQITVNRKNIYLGLFATAEDAISARRSAELRYFEELCP